MLAPSLAELKAYAGRFPAGRIVPEDESLRLLAGLGVPERHRANVLTFLHNNNLVRHVENGRERVPPPPQDDGLRSLPPGGGISGMIAGADPIAMHAQIQRIADRFVEGTTVSRDEALRLVRRDLPGLAAADRAEGAEFMLAELVNRGLLLALPDGALVRPRRRRVDEVPAEPNPAYNQFRTAVQREVASTVRDLLPQIVRDVLAEAGRP